MYPLLNRSAYPYVFRKYAHVNDGSEASDDYWDADRGFKNHVQCDWNWGHIRVYANTDEDYSYNLTYGNYILATVHRDSEHFPGTCDNQYSSTEAGEDDWIERVEDNLEVSPYNWYIEDQFNWQNGYFVNDMPAYTDIGGGTHEFQSDGWGPIINVSGDH